MISMYDFNDGSIGKYSDNFYFIPTFQANDFCLVGLVRRDSQKNSP